MYIYGMGTHEHSRRRPSPRRRRLRPFCIVEWDSCETCARVPSIVLLC